MEASQRGNNIFLDTGDLNFHRCIGVYAHNADALGRLFLPVSFSEKAGIYVA